MITLAVVAVCVCGGNSGNRASLPTEKVGTIITLPSAGTERKGRDLLVSIVERSIRFFVVVLRGVLCCGLERERERELSATLLFYSNNLVLA